MRVELEGIVRGWHREGPVTIGMGDFLKTTTLDKKYLHGVQIGSEISKRSFGVGGVVLARF
jgi:hypothetical protein